MFNMYVKLLEARIGHKSTKKTSSTWERILASIFNGFGWRFGSQSTNPQNVFNLKAYFTCASTKLRKGVGLSRNSNADANLLESTSSIYKS